MAEADRSNKGAWWQSTAGVGIITTAVGLLVTVGTGVKGHFDKERELQLARQKQNHEVRLQYLDQLQKDTHSSARVLRYLANMSDDEPVRRWAVEELRLVEADRGRLEKEKGEAEARAAAAEKAAEEALAKAAIAEETQRRIERTASGDQQARAEAERKLKRAEDELVRARTLVDKRSAEVLDKKEALGEVAPRYLRGASSTVIRATRDPRLQMMQAAQ